MKIYCIKPPKVIRKILRLFVKKRQNKSDLN